MNKIYKYYNRFRLYSHLKKEEFRLPDSPRCLIFLAADYGNLGDVAITYAQKKFLLQHFPSYEVIEVPAAKTLPYLQSIKKQINSGDVITVVGGGNMGDMYFDIELFRLLVVKSFPDNQIILFPQTIDYSYSKEADTLLNLSKKIYGKHPDLTMCAREKVSFNKMQQYYPEVDIRLAPDIVMTLDEFSDNERDNTVIFCLRNDKEKSAGNDTLVAELKDILGERGYEFKDRDTHIGGGRYSEEEKYGYLRKLWDEFSSTSLVITDRLHGMIFAFITGTPAIVLPNSNFKVESCYEWIKDCGYVKLYREGEKLQEILNGVLTVSLDQRKANFQRLSLYLNQILG